MSRCDILIAIPCYDRKVHIETATAITNTIITLLQMNASAALFTLTGCGIVTHARNAIVSEFLSRKEKTHLLFIDSDMEWTPRDVVRLLTANVPFAAAPYVVKRYQNISPAEYPTKDLDQLHSMAADWALAFEDPDILLGKHALAEVHNGFAKVARIGAGLMLLRRDMIETMISKYADTRYRWAGAANGAPVSQSHHYGLFDLLKNDGEFISEDYSFCDRWVKGCGGEIWCDIEARIAHHGHHRYCSSLKESLSLRSQAAAQKDTNQPSASGQK